MNVTIAIPDDVAARLGSEAELERRALEALALEEFRAGRLTRPELGRMLALADRSLLDGFLQAHGVTTATPAGPDDDAAADALVARFRAFAAKHTLGGPDIKALISEGRR
jgi:hypothetical protein